MDILGTLNNIPQNFSKGPKPLQIIGDIPLETFGYDGTAVPFMTLEGCSILVILWSHCNITKRTFRTFHWGLQLTAVRSFPTCMFCFCSFKVAWHQKEDFWDVKKMFPSAETIISL